MRYSSQFKAEAVRSVIESDRPVSWIAHRLEISPSTLRRWMDELEPTLRAEKEAAENQDEEVAAGDGSSEDVDDSDEEEPSLEYKRMVVRLAEGSRRPVEEVANQLGVSTNKLVRWRIEVSESATGSGEAMAGSNETAVVMREEPLPDDPGKPDRSREEEPDQRSSSAESAETSGSAPSDQDFAEQSTRGAMTPVARSRMEAGEGEKLPVPTPRPWPSDGDARYRGPTQETRAPAPSTTKRADPIELSDVLDVLRRRALLVFSFVLVCTAVATYFALREVPQYRATAVLRLGGTGREAITQGFEAPVEEGDQYVNPLLSQTELLRSRSLIADAVDSVGYRLRPDYNRYGPDVVRSVRVAPDVAPDTLWVEFDTNGVVAQLGGEEARAAYGRPLSLSGITFTVPQPQEPGRSAWTIWSGEEAIDRMLDRLRISPRAETNIVDVSFLHPNPETAQSVVNILVADYQQFEADFAQERSRRRRLFLEGQVAQTDSSLARAQADLRDFQSRGQTYDARQELSSQQQNRMLLDIRRGELDADRRMFRGLLAQLDSSTDEERWEVLRTLVSAPGISENTAVSRIHEQLTRQRAMLDSLTSGAFGGSASSPDVQRQLELVRTYEEELSGAIRSHVASLDARAEALEELADRTSEEISGLPYQLAEEARLEQIVETYQSVSDQLREELQRARVAEAVTVGQVDVIDLATLPYEPEPGTRAIKIAVGLLVGLTFGLGSAFLLEHGNRIVQTRAEVEDAFHIPVLGVIPRALDSDLADLERALSANGTQKVEWQVGDRPSARKGGRPREAYRLLRTNLMFASWTDDVRNIVITSTAPREGKTLTSASLAASLAEEGVRVLLMDADLWRGRIHDMVGVAQSPGLADVLAGGVQVRDAIRGTGLATLDVLPRGTRQPDPSSLARSTALDETLSQLGRDYDFLVIDAPPVLAAGSAPVVPAVADGVLVVVRAGQTDREALRECLRELNTVGASILGIVLNDPQDLTARADRRYYRRYQYAEAGA